jgi:hypothetical protein
MLGRCTSRPSICYMAGRCSSYVLEMCEIVVLSPDQLRRHLVRQQANATRSDCAEIFPQGVPMMRRFDSFHVQQEPARSTRAHGSLYFGLTVTLRRWCLGPSLVTKKMRSVATLSHRRVQLVHGKGPAAFRQRLPPHHRERTRWGHRPATRARLRVQEKGSLAPIPGRASYHPGQASRGQSAARLQPPH